MSQMVRAPLEGVAEMEDEGEISSTYQSITGYDEPSASNNAIPNSTPVSLLLSTAGIRAPRVPSGPCSSSSYHPPSVGTQGSGAAQLSSSNSVPASAVHEEVPPEITATATSEDPHTSALFINTGSLHGGMQPLPREQFQSLFRSLAGSTQGKETAEQMVQVLFESLAGKMAAAIGPNCGTSTRQMTGMEACLTANRPHTSPLPPSQGSSADYSTPCPATGCSTTTTHPSKDSPVGTGLDKNAAGMPLGATGNAGRTSSASQVPGLSAGAQTVAQLHANGVYARKEAFLAVLKAYTSSS